ncbi:cytochrome P450 4C1-like isoform X2 [Euwallacea fornicatus]
MKKSLVYKFLEGWLGQGLLTSTGTKWHSRRKVLTQAFHFNVLQKFLSIFNEETNNFTKQVEAFNAENPSNEGVNILPLITHLTLQSIIETSLGVSNVKDEAVKIYRENIYKMGDFVVNRIRQPWKLFSMIYSYSSDAKKEKSTINKLHEFTYTVMREREKNLLNQNDEKLIATTYSGRKIMRMLDLLLHKKITEGSIDYEGIREEVDTFMFEGHDTTSAALVFLLHCLSQYPDVQEEVRKEILSTLGPDNKNLSFQELQDLPYTERVIKETLRLYPSVPFISRIASQDFVTHTGYKIPRGSVLYLHIFDLHRNPDIYENPLKFDPDRFLPENAVKRHPFAYLPFSAGPRNCIGQKFAMLEIKSVICGILRKFRLVAHPETDIHLQIDLILRFEGDLKIKFESL